MINLIVIGCVAVTTYVALSRGEELVRRLLKAVR